MEMRVGDRVTYKYEGGNNIFELIITSTSELIKFKNNEVKAKVLKIERPNYSVIEEKEKKELLTEEEREFLKNMVKWYNITHIRFNNEDIDFLENSHIVCCLDYPTKLDFNNIETYKNYTLSELRIGGKINEDLYK